MLRIQRFKKEAFENRADTRKMSAKCARILRGSRVFCLPLRPGSTENRLISRAWIQKSFVVETRELRPHVASSIKDLR